MLWRVCHITSFWNYDDTASTLAHVSTQSSIILTVPYGKTRRILAQMNFVALLQIIY
jgi:hypothetical protein